MNDFKSCWSRLKRMANTSSRNSNTITTEEWVRHFEVLLNPLATDGINISDDDVSVDEPIDEIEDYIITQILQKMKFVYLSNT